MLTLALFQPTEQEEARSLILSGLVEHWGWLDETRNPDLNHIEASYADGVFLVAREDGRLVGTGALLPTPDPVTWQVVRMSVAADMRRAGLGRQILAALEIEARKRGAVRLILETTATWQEVIAFYLRCGYKIISTVERAYDHTTPLPRTAEGDLADEPCPSLSSDVYFEKWL